MPDTLTSPMLDLDRLTRLLPGLADQYAAGKPYPHIAMDDFLHEDVARLAMDSSPKQCRKYAVHSPFVPRCLCCTW